jgi:hypothetical protein
MPRARTDGSEDVVVVKKPRAPRTRVISAEGDAKPVVRKRAPRKTAPKAEPVVEVVEPPVIASSRKAPTALASERKRSVRSNWVFSAVATFCVLLVGAGVAVGLFDRGQIDVVTVVTTRNEKIARGEVRDENGQVVTTVVPTQADNRPNGGLTIADPALVPVVAAPEVAPIATSTVAGTGTSTEPVASTTESITVPVPVTPDPASEPVQ